MNLVLLTTLLLVDFICEHEQVWNE